MRPERFEGHQGTTPAQWKHWHRTFTSFLAKCGETSASDKLELLINHISPEVYEHISECESFDTAILILESIFVKPVNSIFARYQLARRKQLGHETLDQFLQSLRSLAKDCQFQAQTMKERSEEAIMDAFIAGLASNCIRQRLLENKSLNLDTAFQQARSLDVAQQSANKYSINTSSVASTGLAEGDYNSCEDYVVQDDGESSSRSAINVAAAKSKCMFCGNNVHPRAQCPARDATCFKCTKKGHFAKVCKSPVFSGKSNRYTKSVVSTILASVPKSNESNAGYSSTNLVKINSEEVEALFDSGSFASFLKQDIAVLMKLPIYKSREVISMASSSLTTCTIGHCFVEVEVNGRKYDGVRLNILESLCSPLILGRDFMGRHKSVEFQFEGNSPKLTICSVTEMLIEPVSLFSNMSENVTPIKVASRKYSMNDKKFISNEVQKLLAEGIIEESVSPWRAQTLVTGNLNHKKRLVIDYSRTINRFTHLEGYPLPRIDELVQNLGKEKYFSSIDLKSAYHQIPLKVEERPFTAFEADGRLFLFTRVPFGLTNAVPIFQRQMDRIIFNNKLKKTYAYLDDIIVCGSTADEHDLNLKNFMELAKRLNLTINKEKSKFFLEEINYLGHTISKDLIKPDNNRLKPLLDMNPPETKANMQRILGLFSYYAKWINDYSNKVQPLLQVKSFPLNSNELEAFENIRREICEASMAPIDETLKFEVETDASDTAIASTLSQEGRPVAFFSRTLNQTEKLYPAMEKEALAIVEAVRHWRHFLLPKPFRIVTDQRAVSFMFCKKQRSRIKNDKVLRWRLELSSFHYEISYRPGKDNLGADALSRLCASVNQSLSDLHKSLCHPGISRLTHFVRSKNLPFSMEDIKNICSSCPTCAKVKPRFYKRPKQQLVQATKPFERLSIDFMGPKPSVTKNKYLLVMIDEFSRFPFVFPCTDLTSNSVINACKSLFTVFGCPTSVHSDRGLAFMSKEYNDFMLENGIIHTTPYHPTGNSQCERANGTIWRSIQLSLRTLNMPDSCWEQVLPTVLHSIRSLLCVATNCTPHERLFQYSRKSSNGYTLPAWLTSPGSKVLLRRFVRNKSDPLVDMVELLEANPNFAKIKYPNGRESTVSTGDLADPGMVQSDDANIAVDVTDEVPGDGIVDIRESFTNSEDSNETPKFENDFEGFTEDHNSSKPLPRDLLESHRQLSNPKSPIPEASNNRPTRLRRPPDRLNYH